jgi:predicted O-methyltransferase YrrM
MGATPSSPPTRVPCPLLNDLLAGVPVVMPDGATTTRLGALRPPYADALFQTIRTHKPAHALEIGMGFGLSALTILAAMEQNALGDLISIDPFQHEPRLQRMGPRHVELAGYAHRHQLLDQPDYTALPRLLAEGRRFQFAYIDGNHNLDYVMVDFFYVDRLIDVGGIVAFNDCHLRAVSTTIRTMLSHRRYREIEVGLPRDFGRDPATYLSKRLQGRDARDRYFVKLDNWEPEGTLDRGY